MKNKEIYRLVRGLQQCGELKGIKFAYAVAKNLRLLSNDFEVLLASIKKLQEEHAKKNEEGKAIIENNDYIMKDFKLFDDDYQKLMNIENEITLHKIKEEDIPSDITAGQLTGILEIIE